VRTVTCAHPECDTPVALDEGHVEISGENLPRIEFANVDEYVMHEQCWTLETANWSDPV
jgi:hypothetical protein